MVDWSLAQQPDIVGNALKYRAAGQDAAESAYDRNALMQKNQQEQLERTRIKGIRQDALGQYTRGDAAGARNTAIQGDQLDLVDALTKLDGPAREAAKERAKVSGSILASWKALPAEQREGAKASLAPRLLSQGWSQEEIAGLPTDDAGIQSGLSMALTADQILSQQNNERDFGLKRDDLTADNRRSDMLASETVRNNRFQNGIAAGNLGVARGNLALRGREGARVAQGRTIPAPVAAGYRDNSTAIGKIDQAISALKSYPNAVGLVRGVGEGINQRVDPRGIDARAAVSDIGSQKIHDRSGANVTASESPRLKPFIPTVTDTPSAAIKKLERMRNEYVNNNAQIETQYGSDNGYQSLGNGAPQQQAPRPAAQSATTKPVKQMSNAEIKAKLGL